jgi:hypothetical protein
MAYRRHGGLPGSTVRSAFAAHASSQPWFHIMQGIVRDLKPSSVGKSLAPEDMGRIVVRLGIDPFVLRPEASISDN